MLNRRAIDDDDESKVKKKKLQPVRTNTIVGGKAARPRQYIKNIPHSSNFHSHLGFIEVFP